MIILKLNKDCIRDLLLYLEKNLDNKSDIQVRNITLNDYSNEELMYTAEKLIEAQFINAVNKWDITDSHIISVISLTYKGHEFLDTIRDNIVWSKTKSFLSKFTSTSIGLISNVASEVLAKMIENHLNSM